MSKPFFRNSLLLCLSVLHAAAAPALALTQEKRAEPIIITSDTMKTVKLSDAVSFSGNVILKKEGMTIQSDRVNVFYSARRSGIREIEALGNVIVRREGRVAHADRAQYYSSDEKIVLTGDARIVENNNEIGGERITLFLRDDRSIVEGGKILFYQDAEQDGRLKDGEGSRSADDEVRER